MTQVRSRRQLKIKNQWMRRVIRTRVVRLSLVILPQILGLAALAGIFYFLRVQETFIAPVSSDGNSHNSSLHCSIRPDQVAKVSTDVPVRIDLLSADDNTLASGEGKICRIHAVSGQIVMDVKGSDLSSVIQQANCMASPRVRVRTRVRRVLDIVVAKGGLK